MSQKPISQVPVEGRRRIVFYLAEDMWESVQIAAIKRRTSVTALVAAALVKDLGRTKNPRGESAA